MSGGLALEKRTILLDALATLAKGDMLLVAKRDRLSRGDMMTTAMIEAAVKRAGARIDPPPARAPSPTTRPRS